MPGSQQPRLERLPDEETIRLVLEAISDGEVERLGTLVTDGVRVVTGRGAHEGRDAVGLWALKSYEHLHRRWLLEELRPLGGGWLGLGRTEYVWREDGQVADSAPVAYSFRLESGGLSQLGIHDDAAAAEAALGH